MKNKKNAQLSGAQVGEKFIKLGFAVLDTRLRVWTVRDSDRKRLAYNSLVSLGAILPKVMSEVRIFTAKPTPQNTDNLLRQLQYLSVALAHNLDPKSSGQWEPSMKEVK